MATPATSSDRTGSCPRGRSETTQPSVEGDTPFAKFGSDTFVVVEKWASMAALQAHAVAPHLKSYAAKTKEWTAERAIHVLESA